MSLTLIKEPIVSGSAWNCAGNPIVYKFQRKDYDIAGYADESGFVRIQITGVDITDQINVGDYIYSNDVQYTGRHLVTVVFFSTHTYLTTDVPWVSGTTSSGYFNILKRSYKVKIELYNESDDSLLFSSLQFSDDATGLVIAFIDPAIKSLLSADNNFDYTGTTSITTDENIYRNFYIKHSEVIDNIEGSQTDEDPIFAVYGAKQIGQVNGGNLLEYVCIDSDNKGKFLTKFDTLKHWIGRSQTVEIICGFTGGIVAYVQNYISGSVGSFVSHSITTTTETVLRINLEEYLQDTATEAELVIGGESSETDTFTSDLDGWAEITSGDSGWAWSATNAGSANSNTIGSQSNYLGKATSSLGTVVSFTTDFSRVDVGTPPPGSTSRVQVALFNVVGMVSTLVVSKNFDFDDAGSSSINDSLTTSSVYTHIAFRILPIDVGADFNYYFTNFTISTFEAISEVKNITVLPACQNPILLNFRNSLGGDTFWLLNYNQEQLYTTSVKRAKRQILFAEHLNINEWEALNDLNNLNQTYGENIIDIADVNKTSKMQGQQVYVIDEDGNKTGIITIPTSNQTQTKNAEHRFQIEIEYPEYFTQ